MAIAIGSRVTESIFTPKSPFFLWARVAAWCGVIYYFSSRPNYEGIVPDLETLRGILQILFRKSCHLGEYAVLMVLTRRAVEGSRAAQVPGLLLFSYLFVLLYAVSDEWHQTFVFGRDGSPSDVFIDSIGAAAGYFFCQWKDRRAHEKEKNQNPQNLEN